MLRLVARSSLVVACALLVAGCGQAPPVALAPADPCLGCDLPLGRLHEHFQSAERMAYPAVAELVAEPLRGLGFGDPGPTEQVLGLSFRKGEEVSIEFSQTLPDAARAEPAFERWLGDLRMTVYVEGKVSPRLLALLECTCSTAGALRGDLSCTREPEASVRVAAQQCRESAANQSTFVSAGNGEELSSVSGTEKLDPVEQERSCMQRFWLERGKVSSR